MGRSRAFPVIIALVSTLGLGAATYIVFQQNEELPVAEVFSGAPDPITLAQQSVVFADGTNATFEIAEPFQIAVAAEGVGKARFMAVSPDGRLFVPDMVDYQLSHEGKIYVLGDFNEATGTFGTKSVYLSGLRGPNSIAFYRDESGQDWIYIALTAHLIRYPYEAGDMAPSGEGEIIAEFPNTQTPGETSVVWHITRTILFHGDKLYVAIGSGCNSCEQTEGDMRAMIMRMNPDGSEPEVYANGLRNSVGIAWADGALYTTVNGVDHLGADRPDELLHRITEKGVHYGWPYCYEVDGEQIPDTTQAWNDAPASCGDVPHSFAAFPPRSAPLGLRFFPGDAHPVLRNAFLVALHGSFEPELMSGYEVVRVTRDGTQEIFMDGFQLPDAERVARPVDIVPYGTDSFFLSDDFGGRIFYISARE